MEAIQELTQINYIALFISIFTALVGIKFVFSLFEWVITKLGLETKWMRQKREEHELLLQTSKNVNRLFDDVASLMNKHKQDIHDIYNDNIKYRKQSCEIRDDLKNTIEIISHKLDDMQEQTSKRFLENEKKENKRVQAEIKDKIAQSYRYYNSVQEITEMELEALEDLISTYENYGGKNSFVHSVVQKEMYTWKKVERN